VNCAVRHLSSAVSVPPRFVHHREATKTLLSSKTRWPSLLAARPRLRSLHDRGSRGAQGRALSARGTKAS
jgi:hypothetical protein